MLHNYSMSKSEPGFTGQMQILSQRNLNNDWIHTWDGRKYTWAAPPKFHVLKREIPGTLRTAISRGCIIWPCTTASPQKQLVNCTSRVQAHFSSLQHRSCGRNWISSQTACYSTSRTLDDCTSGPGWVKHHSRKDAKLEQKGLILHSHLLA